jgi:hypothetical protein
MFDHDGRYGGECSCRRSQHDPGLQHFVSINNYYDTRPVITYTVMTCTDYCSRAAAGLLRGISRLRGAICWGRMGKARSAISRPGIFRARTADGGLLEATDGVKRKVTTTTTQRRNGSRRGHRHLEPTTSEKELNCTEHEERNRRRADDGGGKGTKQGPRTTSGTKRFSNTNHGHRHLDVEPSSIPSLPAKPVLVTTTASGIYPLEPQRMSDRFADGQIRCRRRRRRPT